jgi:ribosomal protein L37E
MNVNKWRNLALVFLFGGFFVMYLGVYNARLLPYLTVLGGLGVLAGILLYFRFGPVNPSIRTIPCPRCGQDTRPTGKFDACSHCGQPLQRTPSGSYEPYVN